MIKLAIMIMVFGTGNMADPVVARDAVAFANQSIASTGVALRVTKIARQRKDPCQRFNMISQRYGKYACMKQWAAAHGYLHDKRIFSALIPPATDEMANVWSYGFASGTCDYRRGFTISTFTKVNAQGLDRVPYSKVALAHEVLHLLGAKHENESCNLMHSGALSCVAGGQLGVSQTNLNRIHNCIY